VPKAQGAITLATKLGLEIDVFLLRRKDFLISAPFISVLNWKFVPINESKKCEAFLAVGQYILQASLSEIVY
jgi:hypothetical protein